MNDTTAGMGCDLKLTELKIPAEAWLVQPLDEEGYTHINVRLPDNSTRMMKIYGWTPSPNIKRSCARPVELTVMVIEGQLCATRINLHDGVEIEHFVCAGS